jgi:uncharacterized protein YjbI with pentapeptide repeats
MSSKKRLLTQKDIKNSLKKRSLDFSNARLVGQSKGISLKTLNLAETNFQNTEGYMPNFSLIKGQNINFDRTDFWSPLFLESYLNDSSFIHSQLLFSIFTGANLEFANFSYAKLQGSFFIRSKLRGANFTKADLRGVDFGDAQLDEAIFSDALGSDTTFFPQNFDSTRAGFRFLIPGANLKDLDLSGLNLEQEDLEGVDLQNANLRGANLRGANLEKANLSGADLSGANLQMVNLKGANLLGANLSGANLSKVIITENFRKIASNYGFDPIARMAPYWLLNAGLDELVTDLREANLQDVNFTGSQLDGILRSQPVLSETSKELIDLIPTSLDNSRERTIVKVLPRIRQSQFRNKLLAVYESRCCLTNCDVLEVLEAAHIVPHNWQENDDPSNGLLLKADLHRLFDRNLLRIEPETLKVWIEPTIRNYYGDLHGKVLRLPRKIAERPSLDALKWRYEQQNA